ncbi:sensor histidine kinase [Sagittula stellata]|uniref:histidine kinase n=1 Tax=Sagittula stellata (strain ATCC 700073 / DSM 11524 / E-37) TaxID=388399 RepID=A3K168_SAGS3|nr:HAMP domain-containing sensor histidine kinase [Sagittula stellata]EBA09533.1 sensor histidine kinase/response regulator [Sagittula stellata E-37]
MTAFAVTVVMFAPSVISAAKLNVPANRLVPALPASIDVTDDRKIENLMAHMVQLKDLYDDDCPIKGGTPFLEAVDGSGYDHALFGCVQLTSTDDYPVAWRVDLGLEQTASVKIWQKLDDGLFEILANDESMTLDGRQADYPRLSSWPIAFGPLETVELRVQFNKSFLASTDFAVTLLAEVDYDKVIRARTHLFGGLIASSLLLIGFFLTFASLLRSRPARRYAVYFSCVALSIWSDQYYPLTLFPTTMPVVTIDLLTHALQVLMLIAHIWFTQAFVAEAQPDHPLASAGRTIFWVAVAVTLFRVVMVASGGSVAWGLRNMDAVPSLSDTVQLILMVISMYTGLLLLPAMAATYAAAVSVMLVARRIDGGWLFALGALVLFSAVLLTLWMRQISGLPGEVQRDTVWYAVLYVIDGLIFAAAIARQTFGLRRQRDIALEAELDASREQTRLAQSLLSARDDLDRARDLAERHRSRLALTSHDLRQPLLSLRLSLQEAEREAPSLADALRPSLDYLGAVLEESLEDARPDAPPLETHRNTAEVVPLDVILGNAVRMFAEEAAAKGLRLRHVPCSLSVLADPVPLIRIVSNLLSNAIKYTAAGSVLIGVRRRGDTVALEIHDTGPGLTDAEIAEVRQAYRRGNQSDTVDGEGIGLVSAELLAARHDLAITIRSAKGHGSCFAIEGLRPSHAETGSPSNRSACQEGPGLLRKSGGAE